MSAPSSVRSSLASQTAGLAAALANGRYVCFGGFQLDTQRELLYKDGAKMRLPGKVFQTLAALVEKPGEVVTREALREKLWPQGTFVNYDANVNTTVNKLRLVLGDSPDQPEFIETIPRLGYCFVGSVERRTELEKATPASVVLEVTPAPQNALQSRSSGVQTAEAASPAMSLPSPAAATRSSAQWAAELWADSRSKGLAALVFLCGILIGFGIVVLAHRV
jgi:DNA-binding winged helix-turn-helix (wHTH) protein